MRDLFSGACIAIGRKISVFPRSRKEGFLPPSSPLCSRHLDIFAPLDIDKSTITQIDDGAHHGIPMEGSCYDL